MIELNLRRLWAVGLRCVVVGLCLSVASNGAAGPGDWWRERAKDIKELGDTVREVGRAIGGSRQKAEDATPSKAPSELTRQETYELQVALNRLGFNVGVPDGISGPNTRRAVADFERSQGFSETGALTIRTYTAARRAASALAEGSDLADDAGLGEAPFDGGGGLVATDVGEGVRSGSDAEAGVIVEREVLPGDDLLRPLRLPTWKGLALIRGQQTRLTIDERLFLRALGREVVLGRQWSQYDVSNLLAVREDKRSRYGSCGTRRSAEKCDLKGTGLRPDEFALKEARERFASEVEPRVAARNKLAPREFYWSGTVALGRYDFDRQFMPLNHLFGGNRFREFWKILLPEGLPLDEARAEKLKSLESLAPNRIERNGLSWLVKVTLDEGGNAEAHEVTYYVDDRFTQPVHAMPLQSVSERNAEAAHAAAQAESAAKAEAERKKAVEAEAAAQAREQEISAITERQFDVRGVRLEMNLEHAIEKLEGDGFEVNRSPKVYSGLHGSRCSSEEHARQDPKCLDKLYPLFRIAAQATREYNPRLIDRINLFVSGHPEEETHIVAVVRTIKDDDDAVEFNGHLRKRYGQSVGDGYRQVWLQNGELQYKAKHEKSFLNTCAQLVPWPVSSGRLSGGGFRKACGQILVSLSEDADVLYLVDTQYTHRAHTRLQEMRDEAKASQPALAF